MGLPEIIIDNNFHYNAKNFSVKTRGAFPCFYYGTFLHKKEAVGQTKLKVQKTNTASARKPRAAVLK